MALPAAIQAALARGIAAYLREAPPTDVPSKLRRFAGWRDQALKPHRAQLIAGLDDEGFRNKILDWLDDSPPLKAEEARLLAIAAERSDNWAERLAGAAPKAPTKRAKSDTEKLQAELERERARTAKLKDELRAQKEEARGAATASKSRVGELTSEVRDLRAALRQRESELKTVMGERDRARQAIEKEKRSLRREAERAAKAKDAAEERLAASKREVAELKRRILTLEDRLADEKMKRARARDAAKARRATPSGPRRPLPAPKGLLADAPQTLSAWLASDGVSLIVDGYNVGKATAGFPGLELEAMRKRLVDEVAKLARRHGIEATIVFDGAEVGPGTRRLRRPPVKIEFSPPDVIADDVIVARVEAAPPGPLVVATNDKGLQERVAALGATIATSDQLLALMSGRKVVVSPR